MGRSRRFSEASRGVVRSASIGGGAARVGGALILGAALLLGACADRAPRIHRGSAPSQTEHYCAWYGDDRDGVLYFGESAFWWAARRGSAESVLASQGPAPIGRFDLRRGQLLDPLEVGGADDRSGVWDVLAHENGRVYFTTFFSSAGWIDPATGEVTRLPHLGEGLNEIARGPGGNLLVSRYFGSEGTGGSVLVVDLEGRLVAEHPLQPPPGFLTAPKTPAWDPVRRHIWVTVDVLPEGSDQRDATAIRRGAYVIDSDGTQLAYTEHPEIQFVAFGPDGTGYRAEVTGSELALRIVPPDADDRRIEVGRRLVLDRAFPSRLDFAQELRVAPDGRVVVTRWGGKIHIVDPAGSGQRDPSADPVESVQSIQRDVIRTVSLPRVSVGGLYYTGVVADGRICATHCGGIEVVCTPDDAP